MLVLEAHANPGSHPHTPHTHTIHSLAPSVTLGAASNRLMDVADVAECGICTGNLEDLGGAIELPCSCTVPYCQQCWDRTLAASLSKVGLPRCPSCRMVVRPDYDAQLGRLVFSRVADASVRYENWLESLDETLRQHGVSRCDEGTKFIARTQAGHLTKLFVMFAFQETAEVQGRLWQSLQRRKEEMNQEKWFTENEWFVTNQQGEEVSAPREPSEAEFPLQVRYPKTVERPVTELDASSFPLTLTFKEYVVSIDHRPAAGGAGDVLSTFDFRSEGSKGVVVVRDNVGAAKRWKDSSTSVCLHPGDRILEVNGSTEGSEILDQLGRAELLKGSIFKTDVFNPEAQPLYPDIPSTFDLEKSIQRLGVDAFRQVFFALPPEFRAIAYQPPPGVIVDIHSLTDKEQRMSMCRRLNELRRERLLPLATPSAKAFFEEEGFKCVPMSRVTERHFWDLFHRLPLSTTDATKWKAVLKHVDQCPEKPKGSSSSRDVQWASPELFDEPLLPTAEAHGGAPSSGLQGLQQLAAGSPAKSDPSKKEDDYATWVKQRVEVDTAQMSIEKFELDTKSLRFAKKMSAQQALTTLPPLQAMGDVFIATFGIYHRKLSKLCSNLGSRGSKESKALTKLCSDLNVEKDDSLAELLARLRASEIMKKPL
eukprot:s266_g39.t1